MKHEQKVNIDRQKIDFINMLCKTQLDKSLFSKYVLTHCSTFFVKTVIFDNGYQADIKACTSDINESAFVEMVLFDEHGCELACSECRDTINGTFEINYKNDKYIVEII